MIVSLAVGATFSLPTPVSSASIEAGRRGDTNDSRVLHRSTSERAWRRLAGFGEEVVGWSRTFESVTCAWQPRWQSQVTVQTCGAQPTLPEPLARLALIFPTSRKISFPCFNAGIPLASAFSSIYRLPPLLLHDNTVS